MIRKVNNSALVFKGSCPNEPWYVNNYFGNSSLERYVGVISFESKMYLESPTL